MPRKYLVIMAHPDDPDILFGGCAIKLVRQGHIVKFVTLSNGDAGHHAMTREALAERRYHEAQAAGAIAGVEYQIQPRHDCEVVADLALRAEVTGIIRDFSPDVVITHRECDYHADHRGTAQAVRDAAYLVTVPLYCPEHPAMRDNPIFMECWDRFKRSPFEPDAAMAIDDVIEEKLKMIDCHVSQVYEWLPWNRNQGEVMEESWEWRREYLFRLYMGRMARQVPDHPEFIRRRFAVAPEHIESFAVSEYGRQPSEEELREIFP